MKNINKCVLTLQCSDIRPLRDLGAQSSLSIGNSSSGIKIGGEKSSFSKLADKPTALSTSAPSTLTPIPAVKPAPSVTSGKLPPVNASVSLSGDLNESIGSEPDMGAHLSVPFCCCQFFLAADGTSEN